MYWTEDGARAYYRTTIRKRIMTDRVISMSKHYRFKEMNKSVFEEVWGQDPEKMKVIREPKCMVVIEEEGSEITE